tara:strand:+ start:30414 stop:31667 length:1254 start_codon:yes stop_codon:yes gene_type:complete
LNKRAALVCSALAALLLASSAANAQSWKHEALVDKDIEAEQYSKFWEETLHGFDGDFDGLLEQASELQRSRMASQKDLALPVLEQAAKLKPNDPRVHYRIGNHFQRLGEWKACARSYTNVFELDPAFRAVGSTEVPLDEGLGLCLLYDGEFEGAITHFRRLITQEHETPGIQLRYGEALMALGRLDEAIFSFRRAERLAQRHSRNLARETEYALGVALDRAEQLGESRAILARLTLRDSQLTTLYSTDKVYAPASEELYYLGLAYEVQGNVPRAIYSFRRFLSLAPNSPWSSHAKSHLQRSAKAKLAASLDLSGSAQWPLEALREAIRQSERPLRSCLEGYPEVLVTITLSSPLNRPAVAHQARAAIRAETSAPRPDLNKIVECLESAARKIRMPKQSGLIGGHGTAEFTILGTPKP